MTPVETPGRVSFRKGLLDCLPIVPPTAVFGVLYGALAVQVGLSRSLTVLSSVVILTGTAQLAMVGLLPFGPGPVLVATTGLALRYLPMSMNLATLLGPQPWWRRLQLAWVLVDESYGLAVNAAEKGVSDLAAYKTAADLTLYTTWIATTFVGATFGPDIDPSRFGLDVVVPLVYLGLAAALVKGRRRWTAAGLSVLTSIVAILWLPPAWQVSASAFAAALVASLGRE